MRGAVILMGLLLGCGEQSTAPRVVLASGPSQVLSEGARVAIPVDVADPAISGACAPPFDVEDFAVDVDDPSRAYFYTLELERTDGQVTLVAEPRCDAVAPGDGDAIVDLVVRSASGCATAYPLRLQLRHSDGESCHPRVVAWLGNCEGMLPADASFRIDVPAAESVSPLCFSVTSQDPANERLELVSSSDAPSTLIAPGSLPRGEITAATPVHEIPLGDTRFIRGEFDLDYAIERRDSTNAASTIRGTVTLVVGPDDLAIEMVGTPASLVELDATPMFFRLWSHPTAVGPGESLCARVARNPPLVGEVPRLKPYLRLENTATGTSATTGWVCGADFRVNASPPLDAPAEETLHVFASTCTGCDGVPAPATSRLTAERDVTLPVTSVAGQVSCLPDDLNANLLLACADLNGSGTAELYLGTFGGTTNRSCLFAGDSGRHTPIGWAPGSVQAPASILSFDWETENGTTNTVVLGQFSTAPFTRTLSLSPAGGTGVWAAANEFGLAGDEISLFKAAAVAKVPGTQASHLAYPDGAGNVVIRCIASGGPGTLCQNETIAALTAPATHTVASIVGADLNGDNVQELVVFAREQSEPFGLTVHVVELAWSLPRVPTEVARYALSTSARGKRFRAASATRTCETPPCRQSVFAVARGAVDDVAQVVRVRVTGGGPVSSATASTVSSLSEARDVVGLKGRVFVSMEYGIYEVTEEDGVPYWTAWDPVVIENALMDTTLLQSPDYGLVAAACPGGPEGTLAFTVNITTVRYVDLTANVVLP